jgi:THO complex subunit 1
MAISQSSPSKTMAARLRELLQRARDVKPTTTIDPPLQVSELVADNEEIIGPISGDKEKHMNAIETAAKEIFYSKLVGTADISQPSTA